MGMRAPMADRPSFSLALRNSATDDFCRNSASRTNSIGLCPELVFATHRCEMWESLSQLARAVPCEEIGHLRWATAWWCGDNDVHMVPVNLHCHTAKAPTRAARTTRRA